MRGMASVGRRFFAAGFVGFAVLQAIYGSSVSAYAAGVFFAAVGLMVFLFRGERGRGRFALLAAAAVIFVVAFLRQLPAALADTHFGPAWFNLAKWLAYTGGLVTIAGFSPWAGRGSLGVFTIVCGIQHFLFTSAVATLVPAWIPGPLFWTYFAGVALIAGGLGMSFPPTGRLAALLVGGMIATWIIILHIPRALAAGPAQRFDEWTSVFEAMTFSGLAFVMSTAASLHAEAVEPLEHRRGPA